MKSKLFKFALVVLTIGILSACGSQTTETPASASTEPSVPATQAPATSTESAQATEAPTTAPAGQTGGVSFANDVLPILESRCISCHGGERTQEGLSMKTHADLMSGSKNGPVITAGNASDSLLAQLISEGKMPKRGPKLTPNQVQVVIDWINQGALDN
jgi:mono/diheme cytochrome c family protein